MSLHSIKWDPGDSLSILRREDRESEAERQAEFQQRKNVLHQTWPKQVPATLKDKILRLFRDITGKEALSSFTCASCAEDCPIQDHREVPLRSIDQTLFLRPDLSSPDTELMIDDDRWMDSDCDPPEFPFTDGLLKDLLLDKAGVTYDSEQNVLLKICRTCLSSLSKKKMPPLALANRNYLGTIPHELKDLTVVEEAMIARCRAKCWVVQLREENQDLVMPNTQRGYYHPDLRDICWLNSTYRGMASRKS